MNESGDASIVTNGNGDENSSPMGKGKRKRGAAKAEASTEQNEVVSPKKKSKRTRYPFSDTESFVIRHIINSCQFCTIAKALTSALDQTL